MMTSTVQTEKLTAKTVALATLKFVWWVVKALFAPVKWVYKLLAVPKGEKRKPMTLSGKILMLGFCWCFTWFVTGFDFAGFFGDIPMLWQAFWDGRLVW